MKYNKLMKKLKKFLLIFFLILALFNFKVIQIQGNSMSPTLKNGSFAVIDKYLHKLFEIKKGDILLFNIDNKEVVKKIAGFPGDKIEINAENITLDDNEIYILGENLPESIDSRQYGPVKVSQIIGKIVLNF